MGEYYSYQTLHTWMQRIAERVPDVTLIDIGGTVEGRRLVGLRFGEDDGQKRVVVIDAGIHAREWAAIHTGSYFISLVSPFHIFDALKNLVDKR